MNPLRRFHPDLLSCELEARLLPVITNLGVIVLTTGGYVLFTPYPGAAAFPGGSSSGAAIPTSFSIAGSSGISSIQPGNFTGVPGLAPIPATGSSGAAGATITVGPDANGATTVSTPLVTRNTIANDALVPLPRIGRPSGDGSPILPVGEHYRGGIRETVPERPSSETPATPSSRSPHQSPVEFGTVRPNGAPSRELSGVPGHDRKPATDQMP